MRGREKSRDMERGLWSRNPSFTGGAEMSIAFTGVWDDY
jgi:hypothetical protein